MTNRGIQITRRVGRLIPYLAGMQRQWDTQGRACNGCIDGGTRPLAGGVICLLRLTITNYVSLVRQELLLLEACEYKEYNLKPVPQPHTGECSNNYP